MPHLVPAPDAPAPTQTALIVSVPEADAVVGTFRDDLDVAASWGVPAHVTVLYPFVEPVIARDPDVIAALRAVVGTVGRFACSFPRTAWFGDEVVWLAPDPAQPFRDLTAAVWTAFPDCPPYGGAHDDTVPHLPVGELERGDSRALEQAELTVGPSLPVRTYVDRVLLIAGAEAPMSWRVLHELPLGPAG